MTSQSLRTFALLTHAVGFLLVCVFCLPGGAVLVEMIRHRWPFQLPVPIEAELVFAAAIVLAVCLASSWAVPRSLGWAMVFMGYAGMANALSPDRPAQHQVIWLGVGAALGVVVGLLSGARRCAGANEKTLPADGTGLRSVSPAPSGPVSFQPGWQAILAGVLVVVAAVALAARYEFRVATQARITQAVARCHGATIYDHPGTPPLFFRWLDALPRGEERLCLRSVELGPDAGNQELAELAEIGLGSLPHLRELRMRRSRVTDNGLAIVAPLTVLERITLGPETTNAGLAQLYGLPALRVLDLSRTRITGEALSSGRYFPVLACLNLQNTQITNDDLARLKVFPDLVMLDLSATSITDAGLVHLAQLRNLSSLMLIETPVTDAGLKHLAQVPNLKWLFLSRSRVTPQGMAEFHRARPGVWTD